MRLKPRDALLRDGLLLPNETKRCVNYAGIGKMSFNLNKTTLPSSGIENTHQEKLTDSFPGTKISQSFLILFSYVCLPNSTRQLS